MGFMGCNSVNKCKNVASHQPLPASAQSTKIRRGEASKETSTEVSPGKSIGCKFWLRVSLLLSMYLCSDKIKFILTPAKCETHRPTAVPHWPGHCHGQALWAYHVLTQSNIIANLVARRKLRCQCLATFAYPRSAALVDGNRLNLLQKMREIPQGRQAGKAPAIKVSAPFSTRLAVSGIIAMSWGH